MKRKTLPLFAATLALLAVTALPLRAAQLNQNQGAEPEFASAIDDLPLMPGLKASEDKDVLFVEPHVGRIAESEASGDVPMEAVYDFYRRSLPHLGWKVIDGRTYEREGEQLRIDAEMSGKTTTVRFTVKPVP